MSNTYTALKFIVNQWKPKVPIPSHTPSFRSWCNNVFYLSRSISRSIKFEYSDSNWYNRL